MGPAPSPVLSSSSSALLKCASCSYDSCGLHVLDFKHDAERLSMDIGRVMTVQCHFK